MKNRKWITCACLVFALALSGCGAEAGEAGEETAEHAQEAASELGSERAASVDDGNLTDESVALSVGRTTVAYAEYKVYNYLMKSRYEPVLGTQVWDYPSGDGKTIGQDATLDVLRLIVQVKVIGKAAAAEGITLAADEKEEADSSAVKYCRKLGDLVKKENGIEEGLVSRIFEENRLALRMYNIVTGGVDVRISNEQNHAARVQMIYLRADKNDREEIRAKAADILGKAKKASNFYTVAKEYTQADEIESLVGKMDTRTALASAALSLKEGKMSNVVEETDGFYIVYCIAQDTKQVRREYKNQVVEERQTRAFASTYKQWADNYEVRVSRTLLA